MAQTFHDTSRRISEIVRSDYRTADVFRRYNINYCCSGEVSLQDACALKNIETNAVVSELHEATRVMVIPNSLRFSEWKTDFLVDYIVNVHHAYILTSMAPLHASLSSFMESHRKKYPDLEAVYKEFSELVRLLDLHLFDEESNIFPYIKQISALSKRKEPYVELFLKTLRKSLDYKKRQHGKIADQLFQLQRLTANYTFPDRACTNYQVIYYKLKEFHNDLIQHLYLENDVLYPQAMKIEEELLANIS